MRWEQKVLLGLHFAIRMSQEFKCNDKLVLKVSKKCHVWIFGDIRALIYIGHRDGDFSYQAKKERERGSAINTFSLNVTRGLSCILKPFYHLRKTSGDQLPSPTGLAVPSLVSAGPAPSRVAATASIFTLTLTVDHMQIHLTSKSYDRGLSETWGAWLWPFE